MTWSFVGTVSTRFTTAATLTRTPPAEAVAGDLLIAAIVGRGAETLTIPDGWELINWTPPEVVSTIASGYPYSLVMWRIHPGGTVDTGVARSVNTAGGYYTMTAYRSTAGFALKDSGSQPNYDTTDNRLIGGVTADAGDLVFTFAARGFNSTTGWVSAGDPSTASGALDTTTAPGGYWTRRAALGFSAGTGSFAFGIAEGVKTTNGSTGDIVDTALSGRHILTAAAFGPASAPTRQRSRLILTPW